MKMGLDKKGLTSTGSLIVDEKIQALGLGNMMFGLLDMVMHEKTKRYGQIVEKQGNWTRIRESDGRTFTALTYVLKKL